VWRVRDAQEGLIYHCHFTGVGTVGVSLVDDVVEWYSILAHTKEIPGPLSRSRKRCSWLVFSYPKTLIVFYRM
jgi:hypothetical protein